MGRAPYVGLQIISTGRRATAADIVASAVREFASGMLLAGSRLPPVRVLEKQLGISKNTVQAAYDELMARGIVETREREGVFVASARSDVAVHAIASPPLPMVSAPTIAMPRKSAAPLLDMSSVFIDGGLLPTERLAECARAVLKSPGMATLYDAQGYRPLREAIARRLQQRGLDVLADEVVVTAGSQQSLDIVARSLAARRIAVEEPVYSYARLLFESLGSELIGLPLDPFAGLDLQTWESKLAAGKPSLLYAISSFQNPTGYSYSSREIASVLEMCARQGIAILEDDWGSDMQSGSEYRPTLRALGGKNVLYVNSFTKKLLPSLRVGFVIAHESLVPTLVATKRLSTLGGAWLTEAIVAEFLDRSYYDSHLASTQEQVDIRYRACLDALVELMPDGVRWTQPGGGPTVWLNFPRSIDLGKLEDDLAARGVAIQSMRQHFMGEPTLHGCRLGFAAMAPSKLRVGLEIIAAAVRAQLG